MTKTTVERPAGSVAFTLRMLGVIERVGNRLPHPFWLFVILSAALVVLSWGLNGLGVSAESPADGATVVVRSLISDAGVTMMLDGLIDNYATFPPLGVVLVVMLGVSVADRAGLLTAMLRAALAKVPVRAVTFMIAFTGMVAHIASDAAFVVMIPLGAIAYRSVGRNPVLGAVVAFVAVSGGHAASPLVTPSDATLAALTTAAAHTIDPSYMVTPVANYFFSLVSSVVLALVITLVAETLLTRRLAMMTADDPAESGSERGGEAGTAAEAEELPDLSLTDDERRGCAPPRSPPSRWWSPSSRPRCPPAHPCAANTVRSSTRRSSTTSPSSCPYSSSPPEWRTVGRWGWCAMPRTSPT